MNSLTLQGNNALSRKDILRQAAEAGSAAQPGQGGGAGGVSRRTVTPAA
jgi:hypothetical protein